jgi:glycosyltransferase involved in cell wall biosynthesis
LGLVEHIKNGAPHTVSMIVPTRNEAANIRPLVARVTAAMSRTDWQWELVFVDDSDDDTPDVISTLERLGDQVRLRWRAPRERSGGLSGAVIAGFADARGEVFAVIDGDLQHPPELLPSLLAPLVSGSADLVVASRYAGTDADSAGLASRYRRIASHAGRLAAHVFFRRTRTVSDPLGGYFALRRSVVDDADLQPHGFKILLEVLVRGHWTSIVEVPYKFAERATGTSKAGWREGVRFARHVVRLRAGTPRHAQTAER